MRIIRLDVQMAVALLNSHGRRIPHKIYKMLRFSEFDWGEWAKSSLLGAHKFNERLRIRIHHSLRVHWCGWRSKGIAWYREGDMYRIFYPVSCPWPFTFWPNLHYLLHSRGTALIQTINPLNLHPNGFYIRRIYSTSTFFPCNVAVSWDISHLE